MYECFVSSRLATAAVLDLLGGRAASLEPYEAAVEAALMPLHNASWKLKQALDRWPRASWRLARTELVWRTVERLLDDERRRRVAHDVEDPSEIAMQPQPARLVRQGQPTRARGLRLPLRIGDDDRDRLLEQQMMRAQHHAQRAASDDAVDDEAAIQNDARDELVRGRYGRFGHARLLRFLAQRPHRARNVRPLASRMASAQQARDYVSFAGGRQRRWIRSS